MRRYALAGSRSWFVRTHIGRNRAARCAPPGGNWKSGDVLLGGRSWRVGEPMRGGGGGAAAAARVASTSACSAWNSTSNSREMCEYARSLRGDTASLPPALSPSPSVCLSAPAEPFARWLRTQPELSRDSSVACLKRLSRRLSSLSLNVET